MKREKFSIPSDLGRVQKASAKVLAYLKPLSLSQAEQFDIRLCLEEALINAMKYGNGLKRELPVDVAVEFDDSQVRISVEDRGPGFDIRSIKDCTHEDNLLKNGGRGVYLIRQLMSRVEYNPKGNRLLMVKQLRKSSRPGGSKVRK